MWDVSDVNCWERTLFEIQGVVDAECLGFGTLGVGDVGYSGCWKLGGGVRY